MPSGRYTNLDEVCNDSESSVGRYPLAWFFVLDFLLVGLSLVAIILVPFAPLRLLPAWVPTISAVIVLKYVLKEKGGVRQLFSGWTRWRVGVAWHMVAVSPLFINFIAAGVYILLGNIPPGPEEELGPLLSVFVCLLLFIYELITSGLGEELGWRGFALPRLQARYSALTSSLIIGVIWGLSHLPGWLVGPMLDGSYDIKSFWVLMLGTVAASILITWAVNNAQGSLFIATLFHTWWNFSARLVTFVLGLIPREPSEVISPVLLAIYAVTVVVAFGPARLSRRKQE